MDSKISFPYTKKEPFCENKHGVTISDPYRWLEKNEDEEVAKWIQCQNAHTRSILDVIPSRDRIAKRIEEVYATGMRTVPVMRGGKFFFFKREPGEELLSLFVQEGEKTRLLIDAHTLSFDNTAVLKGFSPSWDGHLLAYQVSRAGNDQMEIVLLDVRTGQLLEDRIPAEFYPSMHSGITWSRDNRGFWYTRRHPDAPVGEEKFHQKLYYHRLGISFIEDECLFGEKIGKEDNPSLSVSADGRFLLVSVWVSSRGKEQNDLFLYDYDYPEKGFYPIVENKDGLFFGYVHRDRLYIHTNYQAPFWSIFSVSLEDAHQGMDAWKEIIPEGEHKIEDIVLAGDELFVHRLENIASVLTRYDLFGTAKGHVDLPRGSLTGIAAEEEGHMVIIGLTSFFIPHRLFILDCTSGHLSTWYDVPSVCDEKDFLVKQIWFSSKDGTPIPMTIMHKKDVVPNGNLPTFLYAYGGFGVNLEPSFIGNRLPFLEAGGVYVEVNIRGGGEFGQNWHEAGKQKNHQRCFDDFMGAALWLIENGYTDKNHLAIFGWSNGGLLTAACLNQRPDLFKAVIIGAPVADMMRFHLFHGGRHWIPEYGNPDDPEMFPHLLAYSPCHNTKKGMAYPATLIVTFDHDDRVHPMHAFKLCACLQEANGSSSPILCRIESQAGHGGGAALSRRVELFTDMFAFVFYQLGMSL